MKYENGMNHPVLRTPLQRRGSDYPVLRTLSQSREIDFRLNIWDLIYDFGFYFLKKFKIWV